jgi:aryl-alcohol dehydrogenase-like predicted oxidoreductase
VKTAGTSCAPEPFNRPRSNIGCCLRVPGASCYHLGMRFRTYKNTDLTVSEVGFGLWTIPTGWWGNFTEGEAIDLMHKAFDLGITLFDAADTYGNGLSEELIAKAFPEQRDEITIATKVGYDFVHYGEVRGRGQRENSAGFFAEAITRATVMKLS